MTDASRWTSRIAFCLGWLLLTLLILVVLGYVVFCLFFLACACGVFAYE